MKNRQKRNFTSIFIVSLCIGFVVLTIQPVFAQAVVQKAVLGTAEKITNNVLSVMDENDKKLAEVIVDTQTKIFDDKGAKIAFRDITPSDFVAVVATASGTVNTATKSAQPKRALSIYVKSASDAATLQLMTGIVTGINNGVVTIRTAKDHNTFYNLAASSSGNLAKNLALGQNIVAIGTIEQEGTFMVKTLAPLPPAE
jgi:hypothetical protein